MKSYKDFKQVRIGYSSEACLTLTGGDRKSLASKTVYLEFGDGGITTHDYSAYLVEGECEIGSQYTLVTEFREFMIISTGSGTICARYEVGEDGLIRVYRAGESDCIIQLLPQNGEAEKSKKSYKDFQKVPLGGSDKAQLTLIGGDKRLMPETFTLNFGEDNDYSAYLVEGECQIGDHYELWKEFRGYMSIYDDTGVVANYRVGVNGLIRVYRAGEMGCIIQLLPREAKYLSTQLLDGIIDALPTEPGDFIWTDGDMVLCPTEELAESIADILDAQGSDMAVTGYYDPEEDERNGETDDHTGFWYVTIE